MENLRRIEFKQSKDLKELGFDWKTNMFFDGKKLIDNTHQIRTSFNWNKPKSIGFYSAPTYTLVFEWFREVHDLNITIEAYGKDMYTAEIYDMKEERFYNIAKYVGSYEKAEKEALKKAIEILKERNE